MGKGRQAAKTEIERLKLGELSCEQGVNEVAKMCAPRLRPRVLACSWKQTWACMSLGQHAELFCVAVRLGRCSAHRSCTPTVLLSLVRALSAAPACVLEPAVRR